MPTPIGSHRVFRSSAIQYSPFPPVYNPCPARETIQPAVEQSTNRPPIYNPCPSIEAKQAKSRFSTDMLLGSGPCRVKDKVQARMRPIYPAVQAKAIQAKFTVITKTGTIHVLAEAEVKNFAHLPQIDARILPEIQHKGIIGTVGIDHTQGVLNKTLKDIES